MTFYLNERNHIFRHFHLNEINQFKHKSCKVGAESLLFETVTVIQSNCSKMVSGFNSEIFENYICSTF